MSSSSQLRRCALSLITLLEVGWKATTVAEGFGGFMAFCKEKKFHITSWNRTEKGFSALFSKIPYCRFDSDSYLTRSDKVGMMMCYKRKIDKKRYDTIYRRLHRKRNKIIHNQTPNSKKPPLPSLAYLTSHAISNRTTFKAVITKPISHALHALHSVIKRCRQIPQRKIVSS
jgi:hypothetical protein